MNFPALIEAKRDGQSHTRDEIREIVQAYTTGDIPDYQMSAWLMAVYFQSLQPEETRALTLAMRDSGTVLEWPDDPRPLVDKHSTGGVGDKVSLVLAPILAALGFRVPMISGRGLGITGGTLDKLASIPGFKTQLEPDQIISQVQDIGLAIVGQTSTMVPADKRIYALRDVTGTVPSIPLITASILSKKLSEGIGTLVMDVKFGAAAFMKTPGEARELAQSIVELAQNCGLKTTAFLTDMDTPLGMAVGNWLEVKEAVRCLDCYGPDDLQTLTVDIAATLLVETNSRLTIAAARQRVLESLTSGKPRATFNEMVKAQGGDLAALEAQLGTNSTAPVIMDLETPDEGFITRADAQIIGEVVRDLGGGRMTQEDEIDHAVGLDEIAKPGEPFGVGSVLARVHARDKTSAQHALDRLKQAFEFQDEPFESTPLIHDRIC